LAQAMAKQQALAVHGGKFLNNEPIKKSSTWNPTLAEILP
jgi:hypothetical protein